MTRHLQGFKQHNYGKNVDTIELFTCDPVCSDIAWVLAPTLLPAMLWAGLLRTLVFFVETIDPPLGSATCESLV